MIRVISDSDKESNILLSPPAAVLARQDDVLAGVSDRNSTGWV